MRQLLSTCLCLLVLLFATFSARTAPIEAGRDDKSQEHGAQIESKYDGFNFETIITLKKMRIVCGASKAQQSNLKASCVSIVASLHCPGMQLNYVSHARLQFVFEAKNWDSRHPLGQRDLIAVADDETLRLGTMQLMNQGVDTDRGVDVMKEALELSIPYPVFAKIAKAQTVDIRVGNTSFALKDKNLWALRDLNNRVKP